MVEALEHLRVAGVLPADQRPPAVGAGVVEDVDVAAFFCTADHEDRPAREIPANEIAGFGNLGLVADVEPGVPEDPFHFGSMHLRRGHRRAMHPERLVVLVVDYQRFMGGGGGGVVRRPILDCAHVRSK